MLDRIDELDVNKATAVSVPMPRIGYNVSTFVDSASTQHFDFAITLNSTGAQVGI